jgi:hypothetical protein
MAAAKKKWRPPRKNGGRQEKMAAAKKKWRAIFCGGDTISLSPKLK